MRRAVRVGVDFDNTLVRYDELFCELAREKGWAPDGRLSKRELRDLLRRQGREDDWTALQGEVYGAALRRAPPFPGALEFIARCLRRGVAVDIISHKTLHPVRGPRLDLHRAARDWLRAQGAFDPGGVGLAEDAVHFEPTQDDKLRRVARAGCTHFIDDLPEFLSRPDFPAGVERVLFDPEGQHAEPLPFRRAGSWAEIERWILA